MLNSRCLETVPVNLIQQPVERAAFLVWLIASAQFFTYPLVSESVWSLSWYLTAPVLILASMIIAIRMHNSWPLLISYISGAIVAVIYFNPEIMHLINGFNILDDKYLYLNIEAKHQNLMILGIYMLSFWLLSSYFLKSRLFVFLQEFIVADNDGEQSEINLSQQFESFLFYITFIVLNAIAVLSLNLPDQYSLASLCLAVIFLFISGIHISSNKRGVLLPIYLLLLLALYLLVQSKVNMLFISAAGNTQYLNSDLILFVVLSFALWIWHNFFSQHFNRIFKQVNIATALWPLFGLLILLALFSYHSLALIFHPAYLLLVVFYLFLMLRNTSMSLLPWAITLLFSLFMLVLEIPMNMDLFSRKMIDHFGLYGQQSLLFCFVLIAFSLLWERYLNKFFMQIGWSEVSFKQPAVAVTLVVTLFCYLINIIVVTGSISGWFDLIHEGLNIEITIALVILSFIILAQFMSNMLLANLTHSSLIFMIIVLWSGAEVGHNVFENEYLPGYTLFAVIHLLWLVLPLLVECFYQYFGKKLNLNYPHNFIYATQYWVLFSFVVSVFYLLSFSWDPVLGVENSAFLSSLALLFIASIIMVKRQTYSFWITVSYLLALAMLVSIRFMLLGQVPVNSYDTSGILIISMMLYGAQQQSYLPALFVTKNLVVNSDILVKLIPLTALLTISWQTASLHSSMTLFVLGIFYLLIQKGSRIALYSGFVFINLAMYLWMPLLSNYTNMMLFYVMPVSFSLLFVSHLHRNEMKPELQNNIRLFALGILYLLATADIFISSSLLLFFVGLLLGLLSTIYGISRKTRAFLYAGVGFLIINILGQLIVFYPDDRLGRALILMATGALITGVMVWFNIKREFLLSKIRLFRTDLEQWN